MNVVSGVNVVNKHFSITDPCDWIAEWSARVSRRTGAPCYDLSSSADVSELPMAGRNDCLVTDL